MTTDLLYPHEPTRLTLENTNEILIHCVKLGASDITLQSDEPFYAEIYGRLRRITRRRMSNTEVGDILNGIYGPNGTTQLMSGKDVDTHHDMRPSPGERYRFRVNATACLAEGHDGIQITARTIPTDPPAIQGMNLPKTILDALTPEQGVVYITGATGSGKSTLLSSIIRSIAEDPESHRKVLTYESPIEFVYDSIDKQSCIVSQSEIPRHLPSFAAGVRNALRRKPRLILVGEARDAETISAVMEAAMTGHPVYTTLHSNSVAETMRRLVTTFPADERRGRTVDILETVRLIVSQRLVPTVDGKRVALREYLVFDEAVRDQLLSSDFTNITTVIRRMVREKGRPIVEDTREKFEAGLITERQFRLIAEQSKKEEEDDRGTKI